MVVETENNGRIPVNQAHLDLGYIKFGYTGLIPKKNGISIGIYAYKKYPVSYLEKKINEFASDIGLSISKLPHRTRYMHVYKKSFKLNTSRCIITGDSARLIDPLSEKELNTR
jgi:flavin-dependent dehydrogenase